MKILFIHQNFPGQFIHLAAALARVPGNEVRALTMHERPVPDGVKVKCYSLLREPAPATHPLLQEQESHVLRAEACASAAFHLKREGFEPDLIYAHPGWGEALFIKDVFPHAKLVVYCEYYYALEGQDVGFDPEEPPLNFQQRARLRLKNNSNLLSLQIADAAISPTQWQKSTYPAWAWDQITVIHDGIDLERLRFNPQASLTVSRQDGGTLRFRPGDELLSYVARNLEPVRGFHTFMRALPEIMARRPQAHVLVVGGNEVSYGRRPPDGSDWKTHMLREVGPALDLARLHFVGKVPYQTYLDLLSVSRVHAYWTTPFVLSWSFLEAAASGLPVVASDTPPIREYAAALGVETLDFFATGQFAAALSERLARPARHTLARLPDFNLPECLRRQQAFLNAI